MKEKLLTALEMTICHSMPMRMLIHARKKIEKERIQFEVYYIYIYIKLTTKNKLTVFFHLFLITSKILFYILEIIKLNIELFVSIIQKHMVAFVFFMLISNPNLQSKVK